jgi:hypothetical protein
MDLVRDWRRRLVGVRPSREARCARMRIVDHPEVWDQMPERGDGRANPAAVRG